MSDNPQEDQNPPAAPAKPAQQPPPSPPPPPPGLGIPETRDADPNAAMFVRIDATTGGTASTALRELLALPPRRKTVVIEHDGQRFALPEGHRYSVSADGTTITLRTPGSGGTYGLIGKQENHDGIVLHVGGPIAMSSVGNQPVGYPFASMGSRRSDETSPGG